MFQDALTLRLCCCVVENGFEDMLPVSAVVDTRVAIHNPPFRIRSACMQRGFAVNIEVYLVRKIKGVFLCCLSGSYEVVPSLNIHRRLPMLWLRCDKTTFRQLQYGEAGRVSSSVECKVVYFFT